MASVQISFIVPAYNEERLLPATLASLRAGAAVLAARGCSSKLIVCDNNSSDATGEAALAAGARVVFEPVNQIARARNAGARAASGDWLLFVDADSRPSPELIAEMADAIEAGCLAGGSTVRFDTPEPRARLPVAAWNLASRTMRWAAGSFIFCEAAAFRELGGFSESLYAAEEIEFFRRLKRTARARRRRIVILHRHPLATSSRKLGLYSAREHLGFVARVLLSRGRTLSSAAACYLWYDGRR